MDLLEDLGQEEQDPKEVLMEMDKILQEKEASIEELQGLFERFDSTAKNERQIKQRMSLSKRKGYY